MVSAVISAVIGVLLSTVIMHVSLLVLALCAVVVMEVAGGIYLAKKLGGLPRMPLILLVIGAVLGAVIGLLIANPRTPLSITSPTSGIRCTSPTPQCRFQVTGHATPEPASDLEILVLVYPVSPGGQGWYIQWPPASIQAGGSWSQSPSLIGSSTAAAHNGDTLNIQAVLVHVGAIYNGSTLADMSKSGRPITDVRQITGLVAQSQVAQLTVIRTSPVGGSAPTSAGWTTMFDDTFSGPSGSRVDSKWAYDTGTHYHGVGCPAAWGTGEVESAASSTANVSQDGHGHLLITPIRSGSYWVSGRIETTASTFAAPTGGEMKVVASIRQPSPSHGVGYWPSFVMLGAAFRASGAGTSGTMACSKWPTVGEIDVMENVNALSEHSGTFHCGIDPGGPCHESTGLTSGLRPCPGCQTRYNTYSVVINRTRTDNESITWYLNGTAYHNITERQVGAAAWQAAVDHGFFLVLGTAIGGGYPDRVCDCTTPTASTSSGAAMGVKYVAVYVR